MSHESCYTCGGRGVVDAHDKGDCNGGTCPDCDGTGIEKPPKPKSFKGRNHVIQSQAGKSLLKQQMEKLDKAGIRYVIMDDIIIITGFTDPAKLRALLEEE